MTNGKPIDVELARESIQTYIRHQQTIEPLIPEDRMVLGNIFDLDLFRDFMQSIDTVIQEGVNVTAIRAYFGRTDREDPENPDVKDLLGDLVFVPVLTTPDGSEVDLYDIYNTSPPAGSPATGATKLNPILMGLSTPCPNICNGGGGGQ